MGGCGLLPASGTWASLLTCGMALPVVWFSPYLTLDPVFDLALNPAFVLLAFSLAAYIKGLWASTIWLKVSGDDSDPAAIVIDEAAGQLLTLALLGFYTPLGWVEFGLAFALFRFFDIAKPPFIGWIDRNVAGAQGIMLDDMLAGLYAAIVAIGIIAFI